MNNNILYILLGIIAATCILALYIYLSFTKRINIKFKRHKLQNDPKAFTFWNILKGLGGIENITSVEENKIYLLSYSIINTKYLKSLGVKVINNNDYVILEVKNFNMINFYKKLEIEIEKDEIK
ncbi:hypothetical protein SGLAD_v1c02530 [Spiroplasma gladiatoris]|uniref:PTS EIIB type-1 domain-containing protein n=1 Tax=Spiroplasma gladiatoris TaxID=2143 RepID=A0A4P7AH12_9MOLU|nr:hypothetical protein [Spiroplasma gladiatoris]QBQ07452.1 hypothetical protein SGLAD_v1c02530 [Spiroplasma gladiatoris]